MMYVFNDESSLSEYKLVYLMLYDDGSEKFTVLCLDQSSRQFSVTESSFHSWSFVIDTDDNYDRNAQLTVLLYMKRSSCTNEVQDFVSRSTR